MTIVFDVLGIIVICPVINNLSNCNSNEKLTLATAFAMILSSKKVTETKLSLKFIKIWVKFDTENSLFRRMFMKVRTDCDDDKIRSMLPVMFPKGKRRIDEVSEGVSKKSVESDIINSSEFNTSSFGMKLISTPFGNGSA